MIASQSNGIRSALRFGIVIGLFAASAAMANAQNAPSYQGKQIRMVISSDAGGGYDVYGRALARHIADHIPGKPDVVSENMPGASGLTATNWGANIAPKDGTVIVLSYNALVVEPLFGNSKAKYDSREIQWVGSIGKQQQICLTWHTSPVKTIDDAKTREVLVSATGATGNSATVPKMLNVLLGTKFKVIGGYSTSEMRLAVERGEVEGVCGLSYSTVKASSPQWFQDNNVTILIQTGAAPQAGLEKVPVLINLVKDAEAKQALKFLGYQEEMGRPFFMPPGTPKENVAVIRRAFDETMKDPAFLADAEKVRLEVNPMSGEDMQKLVGEAYATPPAIIKRAADLKQGK
ncbi:MAG TPA: tripartite tricarboxylate transporter substrate-binding protein [Xanthobacteraceae bacterium]|nr:tripartite tricarboxylate transporter substrate-binding protein [Xanthobacteraceae bacterium]